MYLVVGILKWSYFFLTPCMSNELVDMAVTCSGWYGDVTQVASKCNTTMQRGCDVDVQFHVNRACAGRQRCSVYVGRSTFATDPCSQHTEFLVVSYLCLPRKLRTVFSVS